ncbi:hypothetical protein HJC23_011533 [Cyclotella cryptica]|uniref:Uncharacterized protein n=1 Tax=Cyclotella cryptica TaxID=29204 RepID=A0ABD3PU27_9STRA
MQRLVPLFLYLSSQAQVTSFSFSPYNDARFLFHGPTMTSVLQSRNHPLTSLTATVGKSEDEQKINSARSRFVTVCLSMVVVYARGAPSVFFLAHIHTHTLTNSSRRFHTLIHCRYRTDINALSQLLDSNEEQKLEEMKRLIQDIQEVRRTSPEVSHGIIHHVSMILMCIISYHHHHHSQHHHRHDRIDTTLHPQVALPRKVREALAEYHHAETKYGTDSREAKIAYEYFVDISHARDLHPDRHQDEGESEGGEKGDVHSSMVLEEALNAIHVLEELKEIAFVEKTILDRFGTTDFEIGEGFLEREIGREDDDTYGLWV